ncbi:MAG: hypothetical protein K2J69_01785 [Malacoplasma sp.]|nr:hypothetical protein [Malacoplasma sp.]MDE5953007.1 hypothetical protein [Malacoplasma sp.]MDE6646026.1 hypothetical protein [Malacoplasma sp.]MDE6894413.1 hypothetical protein [Malacoplasma sp.]MDE7088106.1 hypothetical protein [Malacoplasma sp.]
MEKRIDDIAIIENYTIHDRVKEELTLSDIHKTPLYIDEYENYLLKIEAEILEKEAFEKELWLSNHPEGAFSKSRNLIKKFKY